MLTFDELWELLTTQDESVQIEAKKASEIGKSIWETICAFSNESGVGGGYLLLGIKSSEDSDNNRYEIEGVENSDKIQRELATQCREVFNIPIRPQIELITKERKTVILAFIPEVQPSEKPVYIQSRGLPKGAFRRVASVDQKCTDRDLEIFYQERSYQTFDQTLIKEASLDDFERQAINAYRRIRKEVNPNATELNYSDQDLLDSLYAISKHPERKDEYYPTIAGIILFGKEIALRRYFPMHRIDYIVIEGKEWVQNPDKRYQSLIEIREPLLLAIPRLTNLILNDLPKAFNLPEEQINRQDIPLIPSNVIREAIVNAVMHRNYREKQPIQIIRYSDRLEIHNAGYSLKSTEELDQPGSKTRNEKIAGVLHELNIAETKGLGIRTMVENMRQANLTIPLFQSSREKDNFCLTLFTHHFLEQEDIKWLSKFKDYSLTDDEAKALVISKRLGYIDNFSYRIANNVDSLTASQRLIRLRNIGILEPQGKGRATRYILDPTLLKSNQKLTDSQMNLPENSFTDKPLSIESHSTDKPLSIESHSTDKTFWQYKIPSELLESVENLGKRAKRTEIFALIISLCQWRDFSSRELAEILKRDQVYLLNNYLNPLISSGSLVYTIPNNPNDPSQAYRANTPEEEKT